MSEDFKGVFEATLGLDPDAVLPLTDDFSEEEQQKIDEKAKGAPSLYAQWILIDVQKELDGLDTLLDASQTV